MRRFSRRLGAFLGSRLVRRGYAEDCDTPPQKHALLSYLVLPVLPPRRLRDRTMFSNRGIAQELPRALNELGYSVDIVNYDNTRWRPSKAYHLFVGHAGVNFVEIAARMPAECVRIYFATGIYWREANVRLAGRVQDLARRRGFLLPGRRAVDADEEGAQRAADGIICLGGDRSARTFDHEGRVIGIDNAVFPTLPIKDRRQPYDVRRKSFLFFSGSGNMLKGLDVVLEAFAGTGLELHVCQRLEEDFARIYRSHLEAVDGIHVHGFVRVRSPAFRELVARCGWVISATCSEGQPGSVLECMAHGLVPVVPDEAHIDVEDWGEHLPDCRPETIRQVVARAAAMPEAEHRSRSERAVQAVRDKHTPDRFRSGLREAVEAIVRSAGPAKERAP